MTIDANKDVALLFSGGRDSSLAACLYALRGRRPHLLSFQTGLGVRGELRSIRHAELQERFPEIIGENIVLPAYGIVRAIATSNVESDFRDFDGKNLILLGEKLALHACATVYAIKNGIRTLADGSSGYQRHLPEQKPAALEFFQRLAAEYDLHFETPIAGIQSQDEVKYALMQIGLSTKALEGISMFADAFSEASSATVMSYLESKESLFHDYVELALNGNVSPSVHEELVVVGSAASA